MILAWNTTLTPLNAIEVVHLQNEVHIWSASLKQPDEYIANLEKTLADDERTRAERFYFERDRCRFIVARGVLRTILGQYLNCEPRQLVFQYGAHEKPYLSAESNPRSLQFNLSHSHELVLYALTCNREIGIDLEMVKPLPDAEQIASNFFSKNEVAAMLALPDYLRIEGFFTYWTSKEAYIKAIGDGLSRPLDQFEVRITPGQPDKLLVYTHPEETDRWTIQRLRLANGYLAALVVEGADMILKYGQWELGRFLSTA